MKVWTPEKICLLILTVTIPLTMFSGMFIRWITGQPISPEGAKLLNDVLHTLMGSVVTILVYQFKNKNDDNSRTVKED